MFHLILKPKNDLATVGMMASNHTRFSGAKLLATAATYSFLSAFSHFFSLQWA